MSQYVFLRLLEMRGTKKNLPIIDISGRILILLRRVQLTNLYNNSNFDKFAKYQTWTNFQINLHIANIKWANSKYFN